MFRVTMNVTNEDGSLVNLSVALQENQTEVTIESDTGAKIVIELSPKETDALLELLRISRRGVRQPDYTPHED